VKHPETSLLDAVVSFDIYPQCGKFSKKNRHESRCAGYVIIRYLTGVTAYYHTRF
jgi:hypothetical protein